jgi:glycosyltransferase involved in cell wall biosynthesis
MQITVVIPAYNEAARLGRVLAALLDAPTSGPDIEVVVAANGCTDSTADVARQHGARVIELAAPSKTAALNAADAAATAYPRIYVDADMVLSPELIRELARAVSTPGILAAVPRPEIDVSASSWPVRAYYAINARLPVFEGRLFGRGVIALSKQARDRFDTFPEIIADDMFLDAIVGADERTQIESGVRVVMPRRFGELVRRVARARQGNDQFWVWMRELQARGEAPANPVEGARQGSWLRDVVLPRPRLWPASVVYVTVILLAEARRRRRGWSALSGWGRRETAVAK